MLERVLKILFSTKDMSQVKRYVLREFRKMFAGDVNFADFIRASEYRGYAESYA